MRFYGMVIIGWLLLASFIQSVDDPGKIYTCTSGKISFISDAPLEVIQATSDEIKGALDADKKTFLFSVNINTFKGFNSGLQREHFNENYLETEKYPRASFEGKIIEDVNVSVDGKYNVRAKGNLDLHGVKQERIIKGVISVKGGEVFIDSEFTVLLEDHNIKIPRVVYQKISPEIQVTIKALLKPVQASE